MDETGVNGAKKKKAKREIANFLAGNPASSPGVSTAVESGAAETRGHRLAVSSDGASAAVSCGYGIR